MGSFVMERHHPDFLKARVMVTLFGGYFGSRLMSNIREEKGYTYGIGAGIVSYPDSGILIISTEAANEYINPIITEVYREMDKLCNEPVPQEVLLQTGFVNLEVAGKGIGHPDQKRDVFLNQRRGFVWSGMQEHSVFAERFTVVGNVNENSVVTVRERRQQVYRLGQKHTGIVNAVIINVYQRLLRTIRKIFLVADRFVEFGFRRVVFRISGSVTAALVQNT